MKRKINSTFLIMMFMFCSVAAGTVLANDVIGIDSLKQPGNMEAVAAPTQVKKIALTELEVKTTLREKRFSYTRCEHKQTQKLLGGEAIVAAKQDNAETEASLALAHL